MQQLLPFVAPGREIAIHVLDHNHGGVDDDTEIDGTDRQQVCVLAAQDKDDDAEEQRERDIGAHDNGAAQIAEKQPLNSENQQNTEHEIMQHGAGGDTDQNGAIVERNQLHARRKTSIRFDLLNLRADTRDHVIGVQRPVHDDDRRHHVIRMVATGLAEPGHIAHRDFGNVFHEQRQALRLGKHDVLDVLDLVALGQIDGTPAVHQPDAANIHRLLPHIDGTAADVDVGVADGADHLGQCQTVGFEFSRIDVDVIFLGGAAPGIDLHNAGHGKKPTLQDPILYRAQVAQPEVRRSDQLIAVDFADQAGRLNLGRHITRQGDVLLKVDG